MALVVLGFFVIGGTVGIVVGMIGFVLLVGGDKATFAPVPLRLTGVPEKPIEVDPTALGTYKVGSYPAWRLGKKALDYYLLLRFGWGNPFHAGAPWKGMEIGLKAMSGLMAK